MNTIPLKNKYLIYFCALSFLGILLMNPAFAVGGLDRLNTFMNNGQTTGLLLNAVTIAIIWAGYKFLFKKGDITEVGKILIDALVKNKKFSGFCVLSLSSSVSVGYFFTKDINKAIYLGGCFLLSAVALVSFCVAGYDFLYKKPNNRKVSDSITFGVIIAVVSALLYFMYCIY